MMKISRKMAISLIFSLAVSPITVSAMQSGMDVQEQKKKTFWQRHKGKLKAGLIVAGVAAITASLAYFHANKTNDAIKKAGIKETDSAYPDAVTAVGLLGPLGAKNTLWSLNAAIKKDLITAQQAAALVFSEIGAALAYYFGMKPNEFRAMAGVEGITEIGRRTRDAAKKGLAGMRNYFKRKS